MKSFTLLVENVVNWKTTIDLDKNEWTLHAG